MHSLFYIYLLNLAHPKVQKVQSHIIPFQSYQAVQATGSFVTITGITR